MLGGKIIALLGLVVVVAAIPMTVTARTTAPFPDTYAADLTLGHGEDLHVWVQFAETDHFITPPIPIVSLYDSLLNPLLEVRMWSGVLSARNLVTGQAFSLGTAIFDTVIEVRQANDGSGNVTVSRDQLQSRTLQFEPGTHFARIEGGRVGAQVAFKDVRVSAQRTHHAVHQLTTPLAAQGWIGTTAGSLDGRRVLDLCGKALGESEWVGHGDVSASLGDGRGTFRYERFWVHEWGQVQQVL